MLWGKSNSGLWNAVKTFDLKAMKAELALLQLDWIEIGSCGVIGLLTGFLFRRYFKMTLLILLIGGGVIAFLDYINLVHIDWLNIQKMTGLEPNSESFNTLYRVIISWMKVNIQGVMSFSFGFLIGHKL